MSVLPQTIFPNSQRFRTLTRVGREVLIRFTFQVSFTSCTVCSGEPLTRLVCGDGESCHSIIVSCLI